MQFVLRSVSCTGRSLKYVTGRRVH